MAAEDGRTLFEDLKPRLLSPVQIARNGDVWSRCPCHDDCKGKHGGSRPRPSLVLHPNGALKCFAGCDRREILEALMGQDYRPVPIRRESGDDEPAPKAEPLGTPDNVFAYKDGNGRLVAEKGRWNGTAGRSKTFRFRRPEQRNGVWGELGMAEADLPLYNTQTVAITPEAPVVYVEGELCVDTLSKQGVLAVTHAGGASQRDFGVALEILRGREVLLWPDNDPAGYACMARVGARLSRIAVSVHEIEVPLPLKGDAVDYFKAGGTLAGINAGVREWEQVQWRADDAITVRLLSELGRVQFAFAGIEQRRELSADLEVRVDGMPFEFSKRLNLASISAETDFRRAAEAIWPSHEKGEWTHLLNRAITLLRQSYRQLAHSIPLSEIAEEQEERFLIDVVLPDGEPTILFADPSAGKSYVAMYAAACVACGNPWTRYAAHQAPVLYVDWEGTPGRFRKRLGRVLAGTGLHDLPQWIFYWAARGRSLTDQVDELAAEISRLGVEFVIIDSAGPASGGRPEEAEIALGFFNALHKLGDVTALILAHINRSGDTERPFGSIFWEAEARRTWFLKKVRSDADSGDLLLQNRKHSDGPPPPPIGLHVSYEGDTGPVRFDLANVSDVPELIDELPLRERVSAALRAGPLTVAEIAVELGQDDKRGRDSIYRVLRRGDATAYTASGGARGRASEAKWALRSGYPDADPEWGARYAND